MKEYIERAPLLERLSKVKMDEHGFGLAVQFGIDHAINCIKEAPAADVTEVRHGRWIPEACESVSKRNRLIEYRVYSCSICGRSNGRVKKRYCPNCGALMDKESEHGD